MSAVDLTKFYKKYLKGVSREFDEFRANTHLVVHHPPHPFLRRMAWHGMVWHGMAWHGMAWHGMAWHGMCT